MRGMEKNFAGGEGCPQLLNLIPKGNGRDWMVEYGVSEEKKLELRLGPPGGEDWPAVKEKQEEVSVDSTLSLGYLSKVPKCASVDASCGARRGGFLGTVEPEAEAFPQQQKQQPGFLQLQAKEQELSQDACGRAKHQSLERKACVFPAAHGGPAAARSTTAAHNSTHTRAANTPVVGWPPIRSFRKNLANTSKPSLGSHNESSEAATKFENSGKGLFVKINMDGIPIGRKIDLKAYNSYDKLSLAVDELFRHLLAAQGDSLAVGTQKNAGEKHFITGLLDGKGEYTLVYEDNEGDRMLVGDVPWDMFVSTAKRLRVLKSSELSVSNLGAVSRKRMANEC